MNRRRLGLVAATLALGAAVVLSRAVQVMLVDHESWLARARRQRERVLTTPSRRGEIRTADGYVLATSVARLAIQVDTKLLPYPSLFAQAAAPLVGCPPDDLERRLTGGARAVWVAQKVDRETAAAVRALAPSAVVLVPDAERVYPLGTLAAPLIGFVGREELTTVGRAGLEHYYDALLAGEPNRYLAVQDAVQRQLQLERLRTGRAGYDLELTLLARLQWAVERELLADVDRHAARSASAVVLEARTGRILALATVPSFDPAAPGDVPPERWRLPPVQDAFEPGSTLKPLIAAAALSTRAVRPGERFDCTHRGIEVAGHWVRDHAEPGRYTLDEIVSKSANAGIIQVAQRLAPDLIWRTLDGFGFGRPTGVGYPGEAWGALAPVSRWSGMSRAGLALGQELTVSPLQLALAYAAVANGGWLPAPALVRQAGSQHDTIADRPTMQRRVMDRGLADRIQAMLERVVMDGTGTHAAVAGYRVAGKTGTAQRAVAGGFDDTHHVAWFAGFLPLPDPEVVIVVAVVQPDDGFWASTVAAPAFARIATQAACILDLPATPPPEPDEMASADGHNTSGRAGA